MNLASIRSTLTQKFAGIPLFVWLGLGVIVMALYLRQRRGMKAAAGAGGSAVDNSGLLNAFPGVPSSFNFGGQLFCPPGQTSGPNGTCVPVGGGQGSNSGCPQGLVSVLGRCVPTNFSVNGGGQQRSGQYVVFDQSGASVGQSLCGAAGGSWIATGGGQGYCRPYYAPPIPGLQTGPGRNQVQGPGGGAFRGGF